MAKALLGYVGVGSDHRLASEVRRLQARVHQLEAELAQARAVNAALESVHMHDDDLIELDAAREPALA
jgi:hypothetical protein